MQAPVFLQIQWIEGVETIFVDLDEPPEVDEVLRTTSLWHGCTESVEYLTRVHSYSRDGSRHTLMLVYSESDNPHLSGMNDGWGISTLIFDTTTIMLSATWANDPPRKDYDNTAKTAKIIISESTEFLGFASVLRRKRRQDAFKRDLLSIDRVCAITGESEPTALDAAHLIEVEQSGGYTPDNGLLLRADVHRLFDRRVLTIREGGLLELSANLEPSSKYHSEMRNWKLASGTYQRIATSLAKRMRSE